MGSLLKNGKNGARELWLDVQKDGVLNFLISEDAGEKKSVKVITQSVVEKNQWTHIAAVFKGGEYLRVYRNGKVVGENTTNVPKHFRASGAVLRIGQDSELRYKKCFKGAMDDVMIWRRALPYKEIRILSKK